MRAERTLVGHKAQEKYHYIVVFRYKSRIRLFRVIVMSLEPVDRDKVIRIAKHYGLFPIRIKGTEQINICKTMDESKYSRITWDDFYNSLEMKDLQVYKDSSSCFLKIMRKKV